jgi:Sec-independent protein secretion pathway component TatC
MSDQTPGPDGTQDTFISHLIELRSRLMRSIIAIVIVLLCLFPWAKNIYALLAAPLWLLYELGLLCARFISVPSKHDKEGEATV